MSQWNPFTVTELLEDLNKAVPFSLAVDWDNSGIQVGNMQDEVKGIYVALDPTTEVINNCIKDGCNVLLTHHPLLFDKPKQITNENYVGRRVLKLLNNRVSCISMHTNFDVAVMGPLVAERFPYKSVDTLSEDGMGTIGVLNAPMQLKALANHTKTVFGLPSVSFYGNPGLSVSKLAVLPGSGHDEIDNAKAKGADVLITGDVSHHNGLDALEKGLCIIDAGHYGLEYVFTDYMADYLINTFPRIYVGKAQARFPYHTI